MGKTLAIFSPDLLPIARNHKNPYPKGQGILLGLCGSLVLLVSVPILAQPIHREIRTPEYAQLQKKLATGWNTWYNNSVLTQTLLPEGFCINLCLTRPGDPDYLQQALKASEKAQRPEKVQLGLRSDDGRYTSMTITYKQEELLVQTAVDQGDELILVSPAPGAKNYLVVETGLLADSHGALSVADNNLTGTFPTRSITIHSTASPIPDAYLMTVAPHLTFSLSKETGFYTGRKRTLEQLKAAIGKRRQEQQARVDAYGDKSESFKAMQTILAWNTIYDAPNHRVITPVSRRWSIGWGGFVLFDWDTYFASYMSSLFNKDLAFANAIEITKAIMPNGFIPNYGGPYGNSSWDRSEPPIGSITVLAIYKRYPEKWFLTEVYDELLHWNRWWSKYRDTDGYLCWGSDNVPDSLRTIDKHNPQAAKYESGLDNSPMYDSVPFNPQTNTMELADVGLMSLYIADCKALAEMAGLLGHTTELTELNSRAAYYTGKLATLWDDQSGIFLNRRLDTKQKSHRLSPTNFYPLLAKACTQAQAERMINEHYFNPGEFYGEYVMPSIARNDSAFKDNDYWRGRIWAPMNFLVYLGLRNYDLKAARTDLVHKSKALLLKSWQSGGAVYENYNAVTGQGNDVDNADSFYHWGALLTFMEFLENDTSKTSIH